MSRRTWADIKQEALLELRNRADISAAGGRLEAWIRDAYVFIATSKPIHELEKTVTFTLPMNLSERAFADMLDVSPSGLTDLKHTFSMRDLTNVRRVKHGSFRYIDSRPTATGFPRNYCRYGSTYIFDAAPQQPVLYKLRYRKLVQEPVFVNQTTPTVVNFFPETPVEWDEPIRLLAVYRGFCGLFEEEHGKTVLEKANYLIKQIPTEEQVEAEDDDWGIQPRIE